MSAIDLVNEFAQKHNITDEKVLAYWKKLTEKTDELLSNFPEELKQEVYQKLSQILETKDPRDLSATFEGINTDLQKLISASGVKVQPTEPKSEPVETPTSPKTQTEEKSEVKKDTLQKIRERASKRNILIAVLAIGALFFAARFCISVALDFVPVQQEARNVATQVAELTQVPEAQQIEQQPGLVIITATPEPSQPKVAVVPGSKQPESLPSLLTVPQNTQGVDPGSRETFDTPQWLMILYFGILFFQLGIDPFQAVNKYKKEGPQALKAVFTFLINVAWMVYIIVGKETPNPWTARLIVLLLISLGMISSGNDKSYPGVGLAIVTIFYTIVSDKSQGIYLQLWGIENSSPMLHNLRDTFAYLTHTRYQDYIYSLVVYASLTISFVLVAWDSLTRIKGYIRQEKETEWSPWGFVYGIVGGSVVIIVTLLKPTWSAYLIMISVLFVIALVISQIDREHFDEGLAILAIVGAATNMLSAPSVFH